MNHPGTATGSVDGIAAEAEPALAVDVSNTAILGERMLGLPKEPAADHGVAFKDIGKPR